MHKLWDIAELTATGNGRITCTAEEAALHTRVMEAVRAVCPEAYVFPEEQIRLDDGMYWVPGLTDILIDCYERRTLPTFN